MDQDRGSEEAEMPRGRNGAAKRQRSNLGQQQQPQQQQSFKVNTS